MNQNESFERTDSDRLDLRIQSDNEISHIKSNDTPNDSLEKKAP